MPHCPPHPGVSTSKSLHACKKKPFSLNTTCTLLCQRTFVILGKFVARAGGGNSRERTVPGSAPKSPFPGSKTCITVTIYLYSYHCLLNFASCAFFFAVNVWECRVVGGSRRALQRTLLPRPDMIPGHTRHHHSLHPRQVFCSFGGLLFARSWPDRGDEAREYVSRYSRSSARSNLVVASLLAITVLRARLTSEFSPLGSDASRLRNPESVAAQVEGGNREPAGAATTSRMGSKP